MRHSALPSMISFLLLASAAAPAMATSDPASSQVSIGEGEGTLFGTLVSPTVTASIPPVLFLPGSGPTDRDGNNPLGVSARPYLMLADALAQEGIASLRVDKRGIAASAAAGASERELLVGAYAEDARAWADYLRRQAGTPCVWLLGHSEGALHALLAARDNPSVCGLVLLAPTGRPFGDVLRAQLRANPANQPILDEALTIIDELEAGRPVTAETMHPALLGLFRPSVQPFIMSLMAHDPAELVRDYEGPVLVVQGGTDLQTSVADAERLGEARPDAQVTIVNDMNHVLKAAPTDRAGNIATYADPDQPLAPGLVDAIVDFLRTTPPAGATR